MKMKSVTRKITLSGFRPIMFDRYPGDNKTELRPDQKMYLKEDGTIYLPALNIVSLLTAQNTSSAPKRFMDSRKYKVTAGGILSFTVISPDEIPFTRDGKEIVFEGFDSNEVCKRSGVYIRHDVARLDKGIPNPKVRPILPSPWELNFELKYFDNSEVSEELVHNLLEKAGIAIGLGTFRGVFGKFEVSKWE